MDKRERWLRRATRALLLLYPRPFRETWGRELEDTYVDRWAGLREQGIRAALVRTLALMTWHSIRDGALERMEGRRSAGGSSGSRGKGVQMGSVAQDVRRALRGIRKKPGLYAAVLTVFALGIGANTVIFSVVNGVLLRPLPYPEPDRLVVPWQTHPQWLESDNPNLRAQWDRLSMAYPVYEDWREMSPVFEELGLYRNLTLILTGGDRPERVQGVGATAGVFRALGVDPLLGRTFLPSEDRVGGPLLAVLSHGLWLQRFGGQRDVIGQTVVLNDASFTIVGVMPPGFAFPGEARIWITLPHTDRQRGRNNQFARTVARLKPGVSLETAQREMEILQARLNEVHPIPGRNYGVNVVSLHEETVGDARSALTLLLGAVSIFLLIACANIASLLLLRATERRKELAVKLSLGAGKGRLLGELLTEGVVLAVLGGALGLILAVTALKPFLGLLPEGTPRLGTVTVDLSVLAFSLALSAVTGILVSLIPGLLASNTELTAVLKDFGRGTTGGRRRTRTQFTLLVSEIALTFVLLVGAGLLTRSFGRLTSVDPGFTADGVVAMRVDMRGDRYGTPGSVRRAFDELTMKLEAIPGVGGVALASPGPFRNWWSSGSTVDTGEGFVETNLQGEQVSPNYFEMLGIPLLSGRTFSPEEVRDQSPVVVVNERMEKTLWPETGALGQRVKLGRADNDNPWLTVVGVVGDVRRSLDGEPHTTLFHPLAYRSPAVFIKTAGDPTLIFPAARDAVRTVDSQLPISSLELLETEINRTVAGPRVRAMLLGAFALFAAFLAALGIFGLLAHAVTQRTNEIGIRMALGAEKGAVMRDVVKRGLVILALGLTLGLGIVLVTVRSLEPFLFQVGTSDPGTMTGVALLLSACTLAASIVPARNAMRVDPVEALRRE